MKDHGDLLQIRSKLEDFLSKLSDKAPSVGEVESIQSSLNALKSISVDREVLQTTRIGVILTKLSKNPSDKIASIKSTAVQLTTKWKDEIRKQASGKGSEENAPQKRHKTDADDDDKENEPTYRYRTHDQPIRDRALQYLFKSFLAGKDDKYDETKVGKLVYDIESGLFDNFLLNSTTQKEYTQKLKSIAFNLKDPKNTTFRNKIYKGEIEATSVATMESAEMASDEKKMERNNILQESLEACQSDWAVKNILMSKDGKKKGQFKCFKCGSSDTVYYQMQTRSSDEPMTTFVTCLQCNNRWKF
ncbi:transcription factor S-II zinc finger domain-containing protein [Babesia gibsoni]|uniref:Transcription factor S-II zinc finger domain-containing protein n=1 Tax=Babesia gibsoni TaxID=33632 RepID=A0AAD8LQC4_BABGI|nr:transcription factor S-II zinc finger domain-containing protein [Babesia gibsoni]